MDNVPTSFPLGTLENGDDTAPGGLTRRSFLTAVNALALVAILDACTNKHHAATGSATPSASLSSSAVTTSSAANARSDDVLALLRRSVQASPDFLQAGAAKAVASKDVATISAFVRDQISVIPPWQTGDDPLSARRWGSRATLRGGAGTLRDRADLLVELLTAAGFSATVMSAALPSSVDLAALYQIRAAAFEPDETLLAKAVALLPAGSVLPTASASTDASPSAAPAKASAAAIAVAIPAVLQQAKIRTDLLPAAIPVVAVGAAGNGGSPSPAQQYLFALANLAPVAAPPIGLTTAASSALTPNLTVTVSAFANPAPGSTTPHAEVVQLVSGSWSAEDVFGRQIMLNFVPPSGAIGFLTQDPANQPVRIPTLTLQSELPTYAAPPFAPSSSPASSPATDTADERPTAFTGPSITLAGDVLAPTAGTSDDTPQGAYGPMMSLTDSQRSTAVASVVTLQAIAQASTFPAIELDVAVLDNDGNPIDGLDAQAFTVTDNGTAAPWITLMSNSPSSTKPRILVVYDTTGSVAQTWPSAAVKTSFEQTLATTLVTAAGQVPFEVQVVGLDGAIDIDPTHWASPNQAALLDALANTGGDDSLVWGAASGDALDQGVTAIVMVSDFQSNGESADVIALAQRRIAAAHIPVICLTIGKPDATALATMETLSGGTQLDPLAPTTASALAALITPLVAARTRNTYRIRYTAPTAGPTTHTVRVSITGRANLAATASYVAPATPAAPWAFTGLYVRISLGDYDTEVRHLAGLHLSDTGPIEAIDDPTAAAETRAAIFGLTTIAIEPGFVTTAAILDDLIASVQSLQPILALPKTASPQDIVDASSKNGVRRVPPSIVSLLLPPRAQTTPSAVPTMRLAILQERANTTGGVDIRSDLPPVMNTIEPLGSDPAAAFSAALALSTEAAAAEAATFSTSAFDSLQGQSLTFLPVGDRSPWDTYLNALPVASQPAWEAVINNAWQTASQHALVPSGGAPAAFWIVDADTGAATAVLLDGSGGAFTDSVNCGSSVALDYLGDFIDLANVMITWYTAACIAAHGQAYLCLGENASARYKEAAIILAVIGIGKLSKAGLALALVNIGSAFIPFDFAGKGIAGLQIMGTVALAVVGGRFCS